MNAKKGVAVAIVLTIALARVPAAHSTKPCPPSPCENAAGRFNRAKCESNADWIALGTVTGVAHRREGHPTGKDFAEFTFTPRVWEKKAKDASRIFRFTVGWCDNRQELPARTTGMFRVFGLDPKAGASKEPSYLHLEPVADKEAR